jgi:putative ABC transport system substrate-binding protein
MRRREFTTVVGGAAVSWPLMAHAQQQPDRMRRIGWLVGLRESDPEAQRRTAAFVQELEHLGWTPGGNIQIDYRWLSDSVERNETYAQQLTALKPDVLVTSSTPAAKVLRQRTGTATPIVFAIVTDPVSSGLVTSLASPGGNTTGFTNFEFNMGGKWLEVLKTAAPAVTKVALIYNPKTTPYAGYLRSIETSAPSLGVELIARGIADVAGITAVTAMAGAANGGIIVFPDFFTSANNELIIAAAAQNRVPAIYPYRYFAANGGLMSYGVNNRRAAGYVNRILRGAKPSELPVQAPNKFELVVNFKTAKALGLTIPQTLLATADEVIE